MQRTTVFWLGLVLTCASGLCAQGQPTYVSTTIAGDFAAHDIAATGTPANFASSPFTQAQQVNFPAGFTFRFYGVNHISVWVNNAGFVNFGPVGHTGSYPAAALPNALEPNNAIYGCHTALMVAPMSGAGAGTGVWTQRLPGPDRFVIQYAGAHLTGGFAEFAIVLYADGAIETHFGPGTTLSGTHSSLPPGIGVENADGTQGVAAPGGYRQMPAPGTAYRWARPSVDLDVVDVQIHPGWPTTTGPHDVHVVIANHGAQAYSGTINVEYTVSGGGAVSQVVTLTNLPPDAQHTVMFNGAQAWDVAAGAYYTLRGAINPPATGDPDSVDEYLVPLLVHGGIGDWMQHPATGHWQGRGNHATAVFNNRLWVLGGRNSLLGDPSVRNDVWSSADGVNWVQETASAPWAARTFHSAFVLNNRLWVTGGADDAWNMLRDVWSTDDGVNWVEETAAAQWPGRTSAAVVVFNQRVWMMGGIEVVTGSSGHIVGQTPQNDVWSSADGVTWVQETAYAQWPARTASAVVFNQRIWLMGGSTVGGFLNDVWSSANGVDWVREADAAPWLERSGHTCVAFNHRMWVIGGWHVANGALVPQGDVWSTNNGVDWALESAAAPWPARGMHTSAVFNDRMWVVGGFRDLIATIGAGTQDIWSYIEAPKFLSTPPTSVQAGTAYQYDVLVSTESTTLHAAGLPAWLALNGDTLSGTPGIADIGLTGVITLTATNSHGSITQEFQIEVLGIAPVITSQPPTKVAVGQKYSYFVVAVGHPAPSVAATGLPAWLNFNAATGELSGAAPGSAVGASVQITLTASNGNGPDAVQTFSIEVTPGLGGGGGGGGCSAGSMHGPTGMLAVLLLMAWACRSRRRGTSA